MTKLTPTVEQSNIISAAVETTANMSVIARAGAAKTSTLVMIAEALPGVEILCLAFNKAIAEEMNARLPSNCTAKTLHGLGYKAWWEFTRRKMELDDKKAFRLLSLEIKALEDPDDRDEAYGNMSEILDNIRTAKQVGYLPDKHGTIARSLINDEDFHAALPMEPTALEFALVKRVLLRSFKEAQMGCIDFDDMIYCPALCQVPWPQPELTLVDEAQDLSPINHHIIKKLVRNRRIIAVGDPLQAIYGFRGALTDSMERFAERFETTPYYLTMTFRCSRAVTKNAQWRAEDMRCPDWAASGQVDYPIEWSADYVKDGDAIICRNNAPLLSMALLLIESGRMPEIKGRDLLKPLLKIMKKLGKPSDPPAVTKDALNAWKARELKKARSGAEGAIHDKAACISIFLDKTETLKKAETHLRHLMERSGRIHLMTGHKSKGLEFDNVFFLEPKMCNMDYEQDQNLKYVIETRAKQNLTYVGLKNFLLPSD